MLRRMRFQQLHKWHSQSAASPVYALLKKRSRVFPFLSTTDVICLASVSIIGIGAAIGPLFGLRSGIVYVLQLLFVVLGTAQMISLWIQPKRKWEHLRESGTLNQILSTPTEFSSVLGPFVLIARNKLLFAFAIFLLISAMPINVADRSIQFSMFLWVGIAVFCCLAGCVLEPLLLVSDSVYWYLRSKGFPEMAGYILSLLCGFVFLSLFCVATIGGYLVIEHFGDGFIASFMIFVWPVLLGGLFYLFSYMLAERLFSLSIKQFAFTLFDCNPPAPFRPVKPKEASHA